MADFQLRKKPASRELLEQKLQSRGLSPALAASAADAAIAGTTESDRAQALIHAELAKTSGLADLRARRKLASLLARRGFDEETATSALDTILGPLPTHNDAHEAHHAEDDQ